jgi:hypothetical protein
VQGHLAAAAATQFTERTEEPAMASAPNDPTPCARCGKALPPVESGTDSYRNPGESVVCWECKKKRWFIILALCLVIPTMAAIPFATQVKGFLQQFAIPAEKARVEGVVKEWLMDQGIQGGVEPVVELTKNANDIWEGTARFGNIVYRIEAKRQGRGYLIKRS